MNMKSIVALAAISFINVAFAAFPDKPIKIVVPIAAGGTTDLVVRAIADPLGKELGQPVIVENNGGQGGVLGTLDVRDAEPDGYTLGVSTVFSHATNPAYQKNIGYDPIEDFTHVGNIATAPGIIAVNSKFPANNYKEFEEAIKSKKTGFSYASSGQGGMQHLLMEYYKSFTKPSISHVPYRMAYYAISAPAGLPAEKTNKINSALKVVLSKPEIKDAIEKLGAFVDYKTPDQTKKLVTDEFNSYKEIITSQKLLSQ